MKKQTNPSIKAYLIRGAFYLLLLIPVCAIPVALAQRNVAKQGMTKAVLKPNAIPAQALLSIALTCVVRRNSVTGTAPNRIFHIEWRAAYFGRSGTANFEVRFSEDNPSCFDIIYGSTVDNGLFEESGVQQSAAGPGATTFSCLEGALTNGLKVTY